MTLLIITLVAMALSGFFSGMEIAFVSSNKVRVGIDVSKGGLTNRIIDVFFTNKDNFISSLLIGNNIVNVVYNMAIAGLLRPWLSGVFNGNEFLVLLCQTVIATVILLITGEFMPKTIFRINPNYSLRIFSMPLFVSYCILWPISKFTEGLSAMLMKMMGLKVSHEHINVITVDELDAYLQENIDRREDENKEVNREVKIFENALDFSDTRLRDCMVPRNEIVGVDINETSREQLSALFTSSGLSKIVVYHDSIDNVLGFIRVDEMFNTDVNWKTRVKPVIFAPETLLAKKMMQSLLSEKKSMAIVIDEFGGTSGMVTLEDLVEEIFGEIQDEHDRNNLISRMVAENVYEFSGRVEIEEINDKFHLDLPESDEYQTIAGYLLTKFEAIPNEGQLIDADGFRFKILKKSAARIEMVRVEKLAES
ncbi:MAG: HlyC/CorC family transporter [Muribaculaceae bacterium]|nr:HlyC/CorC family transporter [Muribaculaceae bacterium]